MNLFFMYIFRIVAFIPLVCIADQWPVPPDNISTSGVNASDQQIAVDINGNVVVVWIENGYVKARSKHIGGSWSTTIDTLSDSGAEVPQVVLDDNGNAIALWSENGIIKAAGKPSGGSWTVSDTLSGTGASFPHIAIDSNGNAVAVWEENGFIKSATKMINESWPGTADTISDTGASFPQIDVGADGTVVAVWQGIDNATSVVYAVTKPITGNWNTPQIISSAGFNSVYPKVAVNANGTAIAIWFRFDLVGSRFTNVILQSASYALNGLWTVPVDISNPGIRDPADLVSRVEVDDNDYAITVWTNSSDSSLFNEEWNVKINGQWDVQKGVVESNILAYDLDVDFDHEGNAYVVWMYLDPCSSSLIIQGYVNNLKTLKYGVWNVWTLSNGGSNGYPRAAINKRGDNHYGSCAWINYNGTNNVIQAVTAQFPIVASPSNLSVIQNVDDYGVVIERYNVLSWQRSISEVLGYRIYRNGVYLGAVNSDVMDYVDHNRKEHETVTYTITAYDYLGYQSKGAEIIFTN